jgi:hypothetical protein
MSQCSNDPRVSDLFTQDSHHLGMSVLYLTQNLFPLGEHSRMISLNSHILVMFRNPHDSLGFSTLARQMFPKHTRYLLDAFHDATSRPYGYLVIDWHRKICVWGPTFYQKRNRLFMWNMLKSWACIREGSFSRCQSAWKEVCRIFRSWGNVDLNYVKWW